MIPLPAILTVGIFVLGLLWLFILAFSGSRRIPPTHETTGLLHALVIIAVSVFAVLFVHALMFWKLAAYSTIPNLSRAIAIILLVTCVIIPAGLFGLPLFQWLSIKARFLNPGDEDGIIVAKSIAADLVQNMDGRLTTRVSALEESNISPFVFGFPWGPVWLVLPKNFDDMCARACSGDIACRDALIRLILSHELSHIAGRDLLTLPLLWGYCLLTSIAFSALLALFPFIAKTPYQEIILPLAVLMLVSAGVGLLLRYRILKARESLADATATLAVSPVMLNRLIAGQADGRPSALEAFLFLISFGRSRHKTFHWSFLGESGWFPRIASIKSGGLQGLHSISSARGELLRGRTHLLPKNPLYFPLAIITASLLSAFIWWICARLKVCLILLNCIPATAKGNWLVPSFDIDWNMHASVISAVFMTLTPVFSGIVMVTVLLLPFRDVFFEGIRMRRLELGKLFGISLLAAALAGVFVSLLSPGLVKPLFKTILLLPSTIPYRLSAMTACVLFLVFVLVKWTPLLNNLRWLARRLIPMLCMMFVPLIISVLFFNHISILARIILFIPSAMAVGTLHSLMSNPKPEKDAYIASEWLEYERIVFYKRLRLKTPMELKLFDVSDVFAGISRGAITFSVPILVIMAFAYPLLIHFDHWFSSNLPLFQAKVVELNNIPMDIARGMKWHIVRSYLGAYILVDLHKAFGWQASSILIGFSLILLAIPFFGALIFRLYQDAENRFVTLERYPILFRFCDLLHLPLTGTIESSYISEVNAAISPATSFLNGPERVPRMRATCEALILLGHNIPADKSEIMIAWLLACASPSGGFGFAPDMPPDPLHTYYAIKTLDKLGRLSIEAKEHHRRWVENQTNDFLKSRTTACPSNSLWKIRLLLRSRVLLSDEKMSMTFAEQINGLIQRLWQRSDRTVGDIADVLRSLEALGLLETSALADEIRSGALPAQEEGVVSKEPKNNLPEIEALVEIEVLLFPADYLTRPCVLQIQDIISKTQFFHKRS